MTTAPSRLKHTIQHYRAALRARERSAEQALNYAHQRTLQTIQGQLDKLYRQIAAAQETGEEISASWLYEQQRLQAIQRLITRQIEQYGALSQMQTGQLQRIAAELGKQAALAQLEASVPAGVKWAFGIPDPAAIANLIGATRSGSPLADLFAGFGKEAAEKASQALITGLTLGNNPRAIAPLVQQALDISRQRALTIVQNEMVRAYRGANSETFQANSDVVSGWTWVADLGGACLACTAMNGTVHSVDEDMESHVRCECVMAPVTKSWDDILGPLGIDTRGIEDTTVDIQDGSEWLANQDESMQRAILGDARYDLYANGTPLKAFVKHTNDPAWGKSISVKPLKDMEN